MQYFVCSKIIEACNQRTLRTVDKSDTSTVVYDIER